MSVANTSTKEFEFFVKSDFPQYRGKYIAIVDDQVVASGTHAKEVWEAARKRHPDRLPTIAKLPKEEVLILGCLW